MVFDLILKKELKKFKLNKIKCGFMMIINFYKLNY